MSGYLEAFLRDAAEAFFSEVQRKGLGLSSLDVAFAHIHYTQGARVLAELTRGHVAGSQFQEAASFLRRLSAPSTNAAAPPVWEAFARTEANPSAKVIREYLRRFGLTGGMDTISGAIGNTYTPTGLATQLDAFIEVRNECAHTGSAKSIPSPSDIDGYVDLIRMIALGIIKVLNTKLAEL